MVKNPLEYLTINVVFASKFWYPDLFSPNFLLFFFFYLKIRCTSATIEAYPINLLLVKVFQHLHTAKRAHPVYINLQETYHLVLTADASKSYIMRGLHIFI